MKNGYYNDKVLEKFRSALADSMKAVKAGELVKVSISNANSKMGNVASVSTLPFITCPARCADSCGSACYAAKLANLRPNVLRSYANNTAIAMLRPDLYWPQVELAVLAVRYFRFHVSGDIMNRDYFQHMIDIARRNPKTEILCFTKRFELVNAWIADNGELPCNLHVLFSGWQEMKPINPHALPETDVYEKEEQIRDNWKLCGGNCFNCACRGVGCWQAGKGDVVAFKKH